MRRERILMSDIGHVSDLLYDPNGVVITSAIWPLVTNEWLESQYNIGLARRSRSSGTVPATAGSEWIEGTITGWGKFNRVYHFRNVYKNYPYGFVAAGTIPPPANGYCRRYYRITPPAPTDTSFSTTMWSGLPLQSAKARAWNSMQPEFGSDFSLMNFLIELKDFRDVAKALFQYPKTIRGLIAAAHKLKLQFKSGEILKLDPTLPASEIILTYNLAIKPLISDLVHMAALIQQTVGKAQSDFAQAGGSLQTSHYSENFITEDTLVQPTGDYFWCRKGKLTRTIFTATLKYRYDYAMRPDFAAWCKYWGFSGSLSVAWNVLPFTFILDYFIRIGEAIRWAERDDNIKLFTKIYGESLKTERSDGQSWYSHSRLRHAIMNDRIIDVAKCTGVLIAGSTTSAYYRYPADPYKGFLTPKVKLPKGSQLLNMLAITRLLWAPQKL